MNWQWLLANGNGFLNFQLCVSIQFPILSQNIYIFVAIMIFFFLIHLMCSLYVLGVLLVFVACIVCAVAHIRSTPLWQPCEKVAANVAYDEFNCLPKHLREITLEKLVDYIE